MAIGIVMGVFDGFKFSNEGLIFLHYTNLLSSLFKQIIISIAIFPNKKLKEKIIKHKYKSIFIVIFVTLICSFFR